MEILGSVYIDVLCYYNAVFTSYYRNPFFVLTTGIEFIFDAENFSIFSISATLYIFQTFNQVRGEIFIEIEFQAAFLPANSIESEY